MGYLCSSLGKKQLMGITGLGLCGFVLSHMVGNLLYLLGPEAYNVYGHGITGNKPIYYTIEMGLLACFLSHILFALMVVRENRKARPVAYAVKPALGTKGGADVYSRTMMYSGILVFVFVVLHLITFRFGPEIPFAYKGGEIRDLHKLMTDVFASGLYVGWYVVCLLVLGMHLSHALWSSMQSLGVIPLGKEPAFRCVSKLFGWTVAIGFAVNPIFIFLRG